MDAEFCLPPVSRYPISAGSDGLTQTGTAEFFLQRQASDKAVTSELFRPVAGCGGAASRRSRPLESCDFENGRAL
jgi:hypothetical protein